ncbi:hypothetical protein BO86DRAFT_391055 [Aspergillus japonicus CBS 114.51]|uniref:Secreted protein n=1 Tax=Aspergillus japonicus CBS 114.51 TaxID=1448312 RepID=A0A8T8WU74_ASPJA|nr:hypothetical protein BO86DRAFT_391055 [Aspergillus japonicus CBS 114.51]RAH79341.1 hypothetical protein BO86DRAFT_391055 [Aspergillus japonicus CBS 114.51]
MPMRCGCAHQPLLLLRTIPLFANRALFETGWFATQTQDTTPSYTQRMPCMPMTASGCVTDGWMGCCGRADGRAHDPPPPPPPPPPPYSGCYV